MDFQRNNLDHATSPYLLQHTDNPVWWQEWNQATLDHASRSGKPLFVSVGYSTCHWCHVMAADAFSDADCAAFLNEHFVSVKVDREERPDIDHFLMTFLVATTRQGGWPLNAFLIDARRPFFAMTYAASGAQFGRPGFPHILERVLEFYKEKAGDVTPFEIPASESATQRAVAGGAFDGGEGLTSRDEDLDHVNERVTTLQRRFDPKHGGFGAGAKFPPHTPLLFLQHVSALEGLVESRDAVDKMIITTLDAMMRRGLHDHLQGGFYRYTVDQEWQIPHFEKMLYDQALLLWNYSLAARQFERTDYRAVAQGIFRCLEETFAVDGLYASGHDADTEHEEGATYVWSLPELEEVLGDDELKLLRDHYEVSAGGNFEGRNHLIRRTPDFPGPPELRSVEETLLAARKKRPQPSRDGKLICSWNALAAVALFAAGRAGIRGATDRALEVTELLVERFTDGSSVSHSYTPGSDATGPAANHRFLSDHAALMLLLTFASGEAPEVQQRYRALLAELRNGIDAFRVNSVWIENLAEDFHPVPADPYDQPAPSGISLAQMALLRHALINHEEHGVLPFGDAQGEAFGNLVSLMSRGLFYVVESPEPYPPESLPVNSMSIYGEARTTCFRGICYLGPPKKEAADA